MSSHNCTCPLQANMTYDQLMNNVVPHNCCAPLFLCTQLDKELRRAEKERDRKKYYSKRLKRQGYTEEQISQMPQRRRYGRNVVITQVEEGHIEF